MGGLCASSAPAKAAPLLNPENSHYYEVVSGSIDWYLAKQDAEERTYTDPQGVTYLGHLVTITSEQENQFITTNFDNAVKETGPWIGGFLEGGVWQWITGEEFIYQKWALGEPNGEGKEDGIHFNTDAGEWNDLLRGTSLRGYVVEYEAVNADIDIDPDTLNLKSRGKHITAYIELPEGYDVNDIDVATVYFAAEGNQISAKPSPAEIGDCDEDGMPDLMVKFDRQAVQALLSPGDEMVVAVAGQLEDGTAFSGYDTIRVISPGGK